MVARRYKNLTKILQNKRYRTIMEIGVCRGHHAYQMIEIAKMFHPTEKVEYYGFDLFEDATKEILKKEFSKGKPLSYKNIQKYLGKTGAEIHLFKGYSKDTLPKFVAKMKNKNKKIEFVFIDGGHSIKTIASDWSCIKEIIDSNSTIIFDDYYNNEDEIKEIGCNIIIDNLDRNKYNVEILEPEDNFSKKWGILKIRMVKVNIKIIEKGKK